jgi:predicted metal-dependent hydrolase
LRIPCRISYAREAGENQSQSPSRPQAPTRVPILSIEPSSIAYRLRRSARARRLRITVRPGGVEVVAPLRMRETEIAAFLEHNRAWIEGKTGALRRLLAAHPGSPRLVDGARIPCRGGTLALRVVASPDGWARVRERDGLEVGLPDAVMRSEHERAIERLVRQWLVQQARADAEAYVARHSPPHGLVPTALRIKEQKRLWGSCTAKGAINLNWRLVLAPPPVFEYVVVHELCHLRVANHQRPFWRLVGQILPAFEEPRRWLRDHGRLLTLKPEQLG